MEATDLKNGVTEKTEAPEKKHFFSVLFVGFVAPFFRSVASIDSPAPQS
jgi:hypothetical protein